MEHNEPIKAGGKEYILSAVTGTVANVEKIVKTHVYGGNQSVSSSNTVDTQIYLTDNNGREHSFQLSDWDIACRNGNKLTISWLLPKGMSSSNIDKRRYILVINHTTDLRWTANIVNICRRVKARLLFAIMGIFALFGAFTHLVDNFNISIGSAIAYGILYAIFGFFPGLIIGSIINTKQAEKEAKRVEPEILRKVHELEQAISTAKSLSETTPGLNKEIVENKKSSKNKIVAIALVSCLLIVGYWGLAHGTGNLFQTQKYSSAPSQKSTESQSFIQTSIVSEDSIQKTIASLEFVSIPAGEFDMGSPSNEAGRFDNEGPVHHVKISKAFYLGKYEITQKQWRDVMGRSLNGDNLPVEFVSWNDVQNFIKKLNDKEGGNKYRLPTEAEWEYAARAGTTTRYSFGDDESKLGDYAWYDSNSNLKQHDVGQKKPNPWGLYDMEGNVREWVQDKYHGNYSNAPTDGSSWESGDGSLRVARGCSYLPGTGFCRSAFRTGFGLDGNMGLGFRLVRIS